MLRIHCFSCQFACYRLLLEFPPTILKQYSVLNTAIFNLKHSSPDSTGKNFPVIFKMCSDTLFEIPRTTFLFPPCWDKIFGTALGMEEFRFQQTPSSRLWCGLIVFSIYTLSDLGVLSNLIGSLSLANEHYSPPTE